VELGVPAGATLFLLTNCRGSSEPYVGGRVPELLKNSTDLDIDKGTIRWLFTKRDKSSNAFAAAVAHVQRGGRMVVASRTDAETIKMMGEICEVEDIRSGRFLVEEGDYLIEEVATGTLHKQLSPACITRGIFANTVFLTRQLNEDPDTQSLRGRWCTTCCYEPATAVMHFQELDAEGTDSYLHWTPPPKPPPPQPGPVPMPMPMPVPMAAQGFRTTVPKRKAPYRLTSKASVKREPGAAGRFAAAAPLPKYAKGPAMYPKATSGHNRFLPMKSEEPQRPVRRVPLKPPVPVKAERLEAPAPGLGEKDRFRPDRKRVAARQAPPPPRAPEIQPPAKRRYVRRSGASIPQLAESSRSIVKREAMAARTVVKKELDG